MVRATVVISLLFVLLLPATVEGRENKRQYRWADLAGRITGRKIALVLPDGTDIRGKVLGVDSDRLRLKIQETSNPAVHPKGHGEIPAQSVSVLRVIETGKKWRILCTIAMPFVVVGAIAGAAGDLPESGASGEGAVAAGVAASFAGGYLLGWAVDRKTSEIEVIR